MNTNSFWHFFFELLKNWLALNHFNRWLPSCERMFSVFWTRPTPWPFSVRLSDPLVPFRLTLKYFRNQKKVYQGNNVSKRDSRRRNQRFHICGSTIMWHLVKWHDTVVWLVTWLHHIQFTKIKRYYKPIILLRNLFLVQVFFHFFVKLLLSNFFFFLALSTASTTTTTAVSLSATTSTTAWWIISSWWSRTRSISSAYATTESTIIATTTNDGYCHCSSWKIKVMLWFIIIWPYHQEEHHCIVLLLFQHQMLGWIQFQLDLLIYQIDRIRLSPFSSRRILQIIPTKISNRVWWIETLLTSISASVTPKSRLSTSNFEAALDARPPRPPFYRNHYSFYS